MTSIINQRVILRGGLEVSSLKSNKLPQPGNLLLYVDPDGGLGVKNGADQTFNLATQQGVSVKEVSGDYSILQTDNIILVDCSINPVTLTLPDLFNVSAKSFVILDKKSKCRTNPITVQSQPGQTVMGTSTVLMNLDGMSLTLLSNGATWSII